MQQVTGVAIMKLWPLLLSLVLCPASAAALVPTMHQIFAVSTPNKFIFTSNGDPLILSWSCVPLALDSTSSPVGDADHPPKLVLSILNEIVQTEVRCCIVPSLVLFLRCS